MKAAAKLSLLAALFCLLPSAQAAIIIQSVDSRFVSAHAEVIIGDDDYFEDLTLFDEFNEFAHAEDDGLVFDDYAHADGEQLSVLFPDVIGFFGGSYAFTSLESMGFSAKASGVTELRVVFSVTQPTSYLFRAFGFVDPGSMSTVAVSISKGANLVNYVAGSPELAQKLILMPGTLYEFYGRSQSDSSLDMPGQFETEGAVVAELAEIPEPPAFALTAGAMAALAVFARLRMIRRRAI